MAEHLAVSLHKALTSDFASETGSSSSSSNGTRRNADAHDFISNKLPSNALLILVYLYNLRVLHHTMIVDFMAILAGCMDSDTLVVDGTVKGLSKKDESLKKKVSSVSLKMHSNESKATSSSSEGPLPTALSRSEELRVELLEVRHRYYYGFVSFDWLINWLIG